MNIYLANYNFGHILEDNSFSITNFKNKYLYDYIKLYRFNEKGITSVTMSDSKFCLQNTLNNLLCSGTRIPFEYLQSGGDHNCLIYPKSRKLHCWGSNQFGESIVPTLFTSRTNLVALGLEHTCAVGSTYVTSCWGLNNHAQLTIPERDEDDYVLDVSAGDMHTCFVYVSGNLACTGANEAGQSIVPKEYTVHNQRESIISNYDSYVTKVSCGAEHTCLIDSSFSTVCFGDNGYGQTDVPEYLSHLTEQISAGSEHNCAILKDGSLNCWGSNQYNQLIMHFMIKNAIYINSTEIHNCVIYDNKKVICWGGKFGEYKFDNYIFGVMAVSAGLNHICYISSGGYLQCKGANEDGQIEVGRELRYPSQIMQDNVDHYAQYEDDVCYMKNGELYCVSEDNLVTFGKLPVTKMCMFKNILCYIDESKYSVRCLNYKYNEEYYYKKALNPIKMLDCGYEHACYLTDKEDLFCWGGSEVYNEAQLPGQMKAGVRQFKAGYRVTCVNQGNNQIICNNDLNVKY